MPTPPSIDLDSFRDATSAAVKALAGTADITITFATAETIDRPSPITGGASPTKKTTSSNGAKSSNNPRTARLPAPSQHLSPDERALIRGAADAKALRLKYSDPKIQAATKPTDPHAQMAFDALEQARVEALGAHDMAGVAANLHAALNARAQAAHTSGFDRVDPTKLAEALYTLARITLTGEEPPPASAALIKTWGPHIAAKLGPGGLDRLKNVMADQTAFADAVRRVLVDLDVMPNDDTEPAPSTGNGDGDANDAPDPPTPKPDQRRDDKQELLKGDEANDLSDDSSTQDGFVATEEQITETDAGDNSDMHDGDGSADAPSGPRAAQLSGLTEHIPYNVFTTEFDEIVEARDLADVEELSRLRAMLDAQGAGISGVVAKLANRLQRLLQARQERAWDFDMDEGYLDAARLARMIANPTLLPSFKTERDAPFRDTIVTLLIDNSGSMRGRPIATAALTADLIARTLERCGVHTEVLGFTTRGWKGGKAREKWQAAGRPDNPGRLNDLRHIIYKSADTPWRRARLNLGLMLKEGLLKENIDGEALVWAFNRLVTRREDRKVMIVISDGAPVDDSTLSTNPSNILERDLMNVVHWIENHARIELSAIGIGHDVSRYYARSMVITSVDTLAEALVQHLASLFQEGQ
jgi:cobaltochelatase CobT